MACGFHDPKLAVGQPPGSKGHVILNMASQPKGQPKKVPSTGTLGPDRTGQGGEEGSDLSRLALPSSPCTLGPCLHLLRSGQGSLKLWVVVHARPGLVTSPPCPVPHYHGQSLDPSRYRTCQTPPCISGGRSLST